ncbi:MAG: chemotaxis protein CheA [Spirochaetes bacterium]|nr:chemotaxis protein CheA [Spirochaetota bacterium]
MNNTNKEKMDLINDLIEKYLLLDWSNKKELKTILKILCQLPKKEMDEKSIEQLEEIFKKAHDSSTLPDKKKINKAGELLEILRMGASETKNRVESEIEEEDIELYEIFLMETLENLDNIETSILKLEKNKSSSDLLQSIFRSFHTIKGVAGSYQFTNISKISHKLEDLLDHARDKKIKINNEFISIILKGSDSLRIMISDAEKGIKKRKLLLTEIDFSSTSEQINNYIEMNYIDEKRKKEKKSLKADKKQKTDDKETPPSDEEIPDDMISHKSNFMKIDTKKMDMLINMIGELVIVENMITSGKSMIGSASKDSERSLAQLKRITKTLQEVGLSLRMIPIKETFSKMQRIVRDYTQKTRKKVELNIHGEETEIDRNMVEKIYEPLVHLIRNSCDHGIESSEERKKKKKPEAGIINLNSYYRGRSIVIEVKDDGLGLDPDGILKQALKKGLVNQQDTLSDQEIYKLILHPGFSTAKTITDVSGRGVGMDVVLKTVNDLRGKVDISTEKDNGTSIKMILPLTLAIIDGMVIRIGKERFIIPSEYIKKNFQPQKKDYSKVANRGEVIMYQGQLLNLIRTGTVFNIENEKKDPWESIVIVVEGGIKDYCIMVDEIIGKQEVVIKNLGNFLKETKGIAGGAVLGDGRIGLIIDTFSLETIYT